MSYFSCWNIRVTPSDNWRPQSSPPAVPSESVDLEMGSKGSTTQVDKAIDSEDDVLESSLYRLKHIARFPFGRIKTLCLLICSIASLTLAILARSSLAFVHLETAMNVYPLYKPVHTVGLSRLHACLNETAIQESNSLEQQFSEHCRVYELTRDVVDDTNWNVARSCLGASIILGACMTAILICTVCYWQTMNLKPICAGLLMTYLLLSCSFLMYDSDLCRSNRCKAGVGTIYGVVASILWLMATLFAIRMDVTMAQKRRNLNRKQARALRRIRRRQRRLERGETVASTESTKTASEDGSANRMTEREMPLASPRSISSVTRIWHDEDETVDDEDKQLYDI